MFAPALLTALALAGPAPAADLTPDPHTLRKEPVYRTKSPRYGLLVFGPEAKERVWLVHDGDTLYVDRNGNGDLTEPGEKVAVKPDGNREAEESSFQFEAGDLHVGSQVHKSLMVWATPIALYSDAVKNVPNARAARAADPKARMYRLALDVAGMGFKGQGVGGRVSYLAGVLDGNGVLLFAARPADAPVIHFGGPLQVTLYGTKPTLRLRRDNDLVLVVGTPGRGPGTLAMLLYEGVIPEKAFPRAEIAFSAELGAAPVRELFELKQRC